MEREINKALPNSRASLTGKLKQYKRDIEIIEKELVGTRGYLKTFKFNLFLPEKSRDCKCNEQLWKYTSFVKRCNYFE